MKERPILFSAPMVRALLAGTKTQTRRIVKPYESFPSPKIGRECPPDLVMRVEDGFTYRSTCPYGQPVDQLWVREAIRLVPDQDPDDGIGRVLSTYVADDTLTPADAWPWKRTYLPPMHCPRGLSRITLEITGVRVERLQDISEQDAEAEGIDFLRQVPDADETLTARQLYECLWESLNGAGSWDANPWVWVVEFKVMK